MQTTPVKIKKTSSEKNLQKSSEKQKTQKTVKFKDPIEQRYAIEMTESNLVEIESFPDYSTPKIRKIERKLGPFKYDRRVQEKEAIKQRGPIRFSNMSVYLGEWNMYDEKHGKGIQVWDDGSKYEGYWKYDKPNGKGRMIYGNGDAYEGEWENFKANGKGQFYGVDGSYYDGDWKNDVKWGMGDETMTDKTQYIGNYLYGLKEGKGKLIKLDGTYDGDFLDDKIEGFGLFEWKDGRIY